LAVVRIFTAAAAAISDLTVVPGILNRLVVDGIIVRTGQPLLLADAGMTAGRIIMLLPRR
jgi:hypothetical protein